MPPFGRQIRVLERVRTFTPLGIRFFDAAFDTPVTQSLSVYAWLSGSAAAPVRAVRTPSGVYAFHALPGGREQEHPADGEETPESAGPQRELAIAVDDPSGRYLPAAFSVVLPLGYRGEFLSASAVSPPTAPGRAYLVPAPSAGVPAASAAAIRADLVDHATGLPAGWAVVRATVAGRTHTAIADEAGRALLLFPLPSSDRLRLGSPPGSGQGAPAGSRWPATVRVWHDPAALRFPFAGLAHLNPLWAARPSLKSILDEQRAALVIPEEGQAPVSELTADAVYGEELVLRTLPTAGTQSSSLWISAGS